MTTATATDVRKFGSLKIKRVEDIEESHGAFIALYASAGAGKTTLAADVANYPELSPVLYMDVEGGLSVIDKKLITSGKLDPVEPTKYGEITEVKQLILQGNTNYKTVVMDNVCEVLTMCKRMVVGSDEAPTQPQWGKITNEMLKMTREWRDMARFKGINVIFNAWDSPDKDESNMVKNNINFTPALREQFPGLVEVVGFIGFENNSRVLDFTWNPRKTQAKFRRAAGSNGMKIPLKIPYTMDNLPLGDILKTLNFGTEWPAAKYPVRTAQATT